MLWNTAAPATCFRNYDNHSCTCDYHHEFPAAPATYMYHGDMKQLHLQLVSQSMTKHSCTCHCYDKQHSCAPKLTAAPAKWCHTKQLHMQLACVTMYDQTQLHLPLVLLPWIAVTQNWQLHLQHGAIEKSCTCNLCHKIFHVQPQLHYVTQSHAYCAMKNDNTAAPGTGITPCAGATCATMITNTAAHACSVVSYGACTWSHRG